MENLINVVIPPLREAYTYRLPDSHPNVEIGYQVEVSLGRRQALGFVVARYREAVSKEKFPFDLKSISLEIEPLRTFLPSQLAFFQWIADYYGEPLANVIDVAVPAAVEPKFRRTLQLLKDSSEGLRGSKEREIFAALQDSTSFEAIQRRFKAALPVLKRLEERGYISMRTEEVLEAAFAGQSKSNWAKVEVELNSAQQEATAEVSKATLGREFTPFLLHGVTGSGKTEVYLEAIRAALTAGLGALIVVPEIALTPQLIDRFRARLGDELAILHSALSKRYRWNSWRSLLEGRTHVAIGARSGIFAPVQNLGLIIVDEEHDSSYKQNDGLRYNARDLAIVLGKMHSCPVVLGSATPSLESYHHAIETKRYRYLSLGARHQATHAVISVVDMNRVKPWELAAKHISPQLAQALKETLEKKEQAFILYNRRGFASYLQCESCNAVVECENCSVTMTYHRVDNSLLCHYCNLSMIVPNFCISCIPEQAQELGAPTPTAGKLVERGAGTEQIFEEVRTLFPTARIERLDRDSASDHETYRSLLERLRAHEIDILVGTQMIAKGHDLPNVTLVGIADCDVGLHLPDFRSSERIFQLLTQAAGRAGRGTKPGSVILQTRVPRHPSLVMTAKHSFSDFAELELQNRKITRYPPYVRLLRVVISSQDKNVPNKIFNLYRDHLTRFQQQTNLAFQVLGPAPTPIKKIKTLWRFHLLIKCESAGTIHRIVQELSKIEIKSAKARITLDVDPQDML